MERTVKPKNVAAWSLTKSTRPVTVAHAPYTSPPKDHVTIAVHAVAINPIDWILQDGDFFNLTYPTVLGIDVAGEIVETGKNVTDLKVGQRVIAHCNGYSVDQAAHGAFQKYVVVPQIGLAELPSRIPPTAGVVLPLGITTAAAGMYQKDFLNLPYPVTGEAKHLDRTLLVWGGSSSVGSCVLQLAAASGVRTLTTASRGNFDYCKRLGAAECFDYHSENIEDDLVDALKGRVCAGAYHAAGAGGAVETCGRVLDRSKGKAILVTTRGVPEKGVPKSVRAKAIASTTIFKNDVGPTIWRKFLPVALEKGLVLCEPPPLIVGEGLNSVQHALDTQKKGISAQKVVVDRIHGDAGTQPPVNDRLCTFGST